MTQREIGTKFKVGVATVHRIIHHFKETGSITPKKTENCGRKNKTSPTDDHFLLGKRKTNPRLTVVDLARNLTDRGVNLHASNVHRILLAAERKAQKLVKKQLLTQAMRKNSLLWACAYQNWILQDWKSSFL